MADYNRNRNYQSPYNRDRNREQNDWRDDDYNQQSAYSNYNDRNYGNNYGRSNRNYNDSYNNRNSDYDQQGNRNYGGYGSVNSGHNYGNNNRGNNYNRGQNDYDPDYNNYGSNYGGAYGSVGYFNDMNRRGNESDYGYAANNRSRGYNNRNNDNDYDYQNRRNYSQRHDERDWWDRAADEVASWFGDEDAERRRRRDKANGPHRGKGPKGYKRSDERIKEDINDRLSDDMYLDASDIDVKVENGDVILTGNVDSKMAKRRAEDIAESISGTSNVENRLRVAKHQTYVGSSAVYTDTNDKKRNYEKDRTA